MSNKKRTYNRIEVNSSDNWYNSITDNQLLKSVVIYSRVSSVSQIDNTSLDTQIEYGIKFYEDSDIDFDTILILREEGRSGDDYNDIDDIVDRELLNIVLKKFEQQKIKHFWVYDDSRLSRNSQLSNLIYQKMYHNDVDLYVGSSKKKFDDETEVFFFKMMSLVNELDNSIRRKKSQSGRIKIQQMGKHIGGRYPFGYKKGKDGYYEIDEIQSKYVIDIFEMFNNGKSVKQIIHYLRDKNIKPPKSNLNLWNEGTIRNILRSTKYIGYDTTEFKLLKNKSKEYCRSKGKIKKVPYNLPKIIDDKLWKDVQWRLSVYQSDVQKNNKTKHNYMLHNLMYCGHCGNKMKVRRNDKNKINIYYCNYSEKNWKYDDNRYIKCGKEKSKSINIDVTDVLVWNEVLKIFYNSFKVREEFKTKYLSNVYDSRRKPNERKIELENSIGNYNQKIKQLTSNKKELFKKSMLLEMNDSEYKGVEKDIDKKIEYYNDKIVELITDIGKIKQSIQWCDWFEDFENQYNTIKEYKSIEDRKRFLNKYIDKIDVNWDKITKTHSIKIHFNLNIVKDKRIRKEKYVFEIINGKKTSTINSINSNKIKHLLNQKKKQNTSLQNHSTVTDLARLRG